MINYHVNIGFPLKVKHLLYTLYLTLFSVWLYETLMQHQIYVYVSENSTAFYKVCTCFIKRKIKVYAFHFISVAFIFSFKLCNSFSK